jgi:beta-lactamase class A
MGPASEEPQGMSKGLGVFAAFLLAFCGAANALAFDAAKLTVAIGAEEAALGARIGVAALDKAGGAPFSYHADERFPLDSTHKAFSCAALLAKADKGEASLQKRVIIRATDLVAYSPVTENHIAPASMSLAEHCAAALGFSDNTAANVVLEAIGGPPAVTDFFGTLGDAKSRLDREEPDLNESEPGDARDTTTPASAVADLDKLLLGDVLKAASREKLKQWMIDDKVAGPLLRKALPDDWIIADKTGSGGHGSRGIIAVIWPPDRAPLVVAIYMSDTPASLDARDAAIARIGAALVKAVAP